VGEDLNIPVYLYEKAATHPDRENLANLRKGEYEGLKEEIATNPDRAPDFGPSMLGTAGATVIGVRDFLVAYNVYLNTDDIRIAKKVAKAVRNLSGGLRYVKGLGMLVDGQAQVSMNLTNYRRTPVYRVVEMIRREAARYGTQITHSELIGLIPQEALMDTAVWHLQLDDFDEDQILEVRMRNAQAEAGAASGLDTDFLEDLAAGTAAPGGGSAAAYSGAMGAALVAMVARLTVGKKKYADVEEQMWPVIERADELRADLTAAVKKDSAAFEEVMAAFKLPKSSEEEKAARSEAIQAATLHAAEVPLDVVSMVTEVIELAAQVADVGNTNAITDGGTGAAIAWAALNGAAMNVRINISSLKDQKVVKNFEKVLTDLEKRAAEAETRLKKALHERGGLPV
jgi:glutamate formiminotransferase/formiminotetrahydrofolate cyclodeaminase